MVQNLSSVEISYFWPKTGISAEIWAEISVKNPVMVGCNPRISTKNFTV